MVSKQCIIKVIAPEDIHSYVEDIARLRVTVFKEYPYLYDGNFDDELLYAQKFVNSPNSLVCLLFDKNKVVGALTGLPLAYEDVLIRDTWEQNSNTPLSSVYYFSEMLMYSEYRKHGYGSKLFVTGENCVKQYSSFDTITLITIHRNNNHPLQPTSYKPLDHFCEIHGYTKHDDITCIISWKEIGASEASQNELIYWSKIL